MKQYFPKKELSWRWIKNLLMMIADEDKGDLYRVLMKWKVKPLDNIIVENQYILWM